MQAYTQFRSACAKVARYPGETSLEALQAVVRHYKTKLVDPLTGMISNCKVLEDHHNLTYYLSALLEERVLTGSGTHIYMSSRAFCDWLVECVKDKLDVRNFDILEALIGKGRIGVIHFPTSAKLGSIAFGTSKHLRVQLENAPYGFLALAHSMSGPMHGACERLHVDSSVDELKCRYDEITDGDVIKGDKLEAIYKYTGTTLDYYPRLICGLGMYADCFPECVTDGVPVDLQQPSHHKHKVVKTISISPKVRLEGHDSPIPHFRKGHFRLLKSARFTHMRWKSVFVRRTFVKGIAKTALSLDEAV